MIDTYLKFGFAGAAVLLIALGFFVRGHRYALWTASCCAAVAGLGAQYDAFWVLAIGALTMVWALVCTTNTVDAAWRLETLGRNGKLTGVEDAFAALESEIHQLLPALAAREKET